MTINTIIGDIPPFECWVRREFLKDHKSGGGEFEQGIAIGAVVRKDMALCFTVLLESGALWYEVPIHALVTKTGAPAMDLTVCQMWDCLSSKWVVHRYEHLRQLAVLVNLRTDAEAAPPAPGSYLFTIDMTDSFYADHPAEHKTLNVIELDQGNVVAYPNNRLLWEDLTFTDHTLPRDYARTSKHYFCETWSKGKKI